MNNRFLTTITLLTSSTLFVAGCGGDSPFDVSNTNTTGTTDNEIDPANTVITEIPDQNSFSLVQEKHNVEAFGVEGVTNIISVLAADRHNNPVPDNTAIRFLTDGGNIEPQCLTTDGACSVTWTEQIPTPTSNEATIIAYTPGEESFTDLNDNDLYDAGEFFTDISEPFFDLNNNGVRDAATEEFVDANGDNIFDDINGIFTGVPCVGDTTVCDRRTTLIWDSAKVGLVHSVAFTSISIGSLPTSIDTTSSVTIEVVDENGNPMADGTTVKISSTQGETDPATWDFAANGTTFRVFYTSGSDPGLETLKIEVTTPLGLTTVTYFETTVS